MAVHSQHMSTVLWAYTYIYAYTYTYKPLIKEFVGNALGVSLLSLYIYICLDLYLYNTYAGVHSQHISSLANAQPQRRHLVEEGLFLLLLGQFIYISTSISTYIYKIFRGVYLNCLAATNETAIGKSALLMYMSEL